MNRNELIKELCRREGKTSQVAVGNMREIVSILEDMFAEDIFAGGERAVFASRAAQRVTQALVHGVQKKLDRLWKKHDAAKKKAKEAKAFLAAKAKAKK